MSNGMQLAESISGKTDRDVAVIALAKIDNHEKICADRYKDIRTVLKWIGRGVGVIVMAEILKALNLGNSPIIDKLLTWFAST